MFKDFFVKNLSNKKSGKTESHFRWYVIALMSILISLGTWNPTGIHFINFILNNDIFSGFNIFWLVTFLGVWVMVFKAISQTLNWGVFLVLLILMAFFYGLNQYELFDFSSLTQLGWAGTFSVAFMIFISMNASVLWKYVTGVYTTDSTDL